MYQLHDDVLGNYATKEVSEFDPEKLYSAFRNLRNLCTTGQDIQSDLCQNAVFDHSLIIIDKIIKGYSKFLLPPLKQGLQFIYNLSVNNVRNQSILWSKYSYLKSWMSFQNEESVRNYVCGTLYNVVMNSNRMHEVLGDIILLNSVIESAIKGADFPLLFIENVFRCESEDGEKRLSALFQSEDTFHVYLLNLLHEYVKENDIDEKCIHFIKVRYQRKVEYMVSGSYHVIELQQIFGLLKILLELSVKDQVLPILQINTELLDATKSLLQYIHVKGKHSQSEFSPTEDIYAERTEVENLKANLIRFIANLCWRNRALQDRIRKTDGLPIILDSCVRDGKNPFITETAIFAIRNLCEFNIENQTLIRNLNSEVHDEVVERMKMRSSLYTPS